MLAPRSKMFVIILSGLCVVIFAVLLLGLFFDVLNRETTLFSTAISIVFAVTFFVHFLLFEKKRFVFAALAGMTFSFIGWVVILSYILLHFRLGVPYIPEYFDPLPFFIILAVALGYISFMLFMKTDSFVANVVAVMTVTSVFGVVILVLLNIYSFLLFEIEMYDVPELGSSRLLALLLLTSLFGGVFTLLLRKLERVPIE